MMRKRIRKPHRMLIAGVVFLLFGGSLLLRTTGNLSGLISLWPTFLVFFGFYLLYKVYFRDGHESNIFSGLFLVLVGAFLLVMNTHVFDVRFRQAWPFFMLFAGVSLLAHGITRPLHGKMRMIIPAISIIFLSGIFLLFSLDVITISLRRFVVMWWPALFVMAGIVLILLDFTSREEPKDNDNE